MSLSPHVAHYRGKVAGIKRAVKNGERPADDAELREAQRGLTHAKATDYIQRLLASAPPLTQEQRTKLAELLAPIRRSERGDLSA